MPQDEHFAAFTAKYRGKGKEQRNKALRAEIPGGNELLDLLELVHKTRMRGRIDKPLDFAELIEDRLQEIRDEMVDEVERRYRIGNHRPK